MRPRIVRTVAFALLTSFLAVGADKPPVLVFGGKQLYVGMSRSEALASLSGCCELVPSADSNVQKATTLDPTEGHFIFAKNDPQSRVVGTIYFSGEKVAKITRPLAEDVDTFNEHLVNFVRAIMRALPIEGDAEATVVISLRHERANNGQSDLVSLSFLDGRGIELRVATLDKSFGGRRDFVTADEKVVCPGYK